MANRFIRLAEKAVPKDTYYNIYISMTKGVMSEEDFVKAIEDEFNKVNYPDAKIDTFFIDNDKMVANIFLSYLQHKKYISLSYGEIRHRLLKSLPELELSNRIIKPYINMRGIGFPEYQKLVKKYETNQM